VSETSEVGDRQALRELVDRYARNADRRNRPAFGSLFTPDAVMELPGGRDERGRKAISDLLLELDKNYTRTMHFVGNHMVDFLEDGAVGETYCIAHHIYSAGDVERDTVMFIRYHDSYVRTAEGWRIARRNLGIDWQEDRPTVV
jgi:uncharacterized protein (TIGR02246 family)